MTRWLKAARQALMHADKTDLTDKTPALTATRAAKTNSKEVKSVLSEKSDGGRSGEKAVTIDQLQRDPETYLAFLRSNGPTTYGVAAIALGWGATRAWQAEAELRSTGRTAINSDGKAEA
jgi:hypothetical protein